MYEKPSLQRFGTLRELTLSGTTVNGGDPANGYSSGIGDFVSSTVEISCSGC